MQGILITRMLSVRAVLLAVLVGGLVLPGAQAQSAKQNQKSDKQTSGSSQAQAPSAGGKAGEEESAPANKEHAGGPQEGIKVHGHWVIDVRDPDGKLVSHREFENGLIGPAVLANVLARQNSVGLWRVMLTDTNIGSTYDLLEPTFIGTGNSNNLTVTASGAAVVLTGSFVASAADTITAVETDNYLCSPSTPPSTPCSVSNGNAFTFTTFSPGISFVAGQTVTVIVTITFS
jgi:hypothetical protein